MYEDDHYESSIEDDKYADAMFEKEYSTDEDRYDNFMYDHDNSIDKSSKAWLLNSERALDTLCLCGLRNRLSHGELEPLRSYQVLDNSNIIHQRAVIDGTVEDITQSDLDVLRAVITAYINTHGYDAKNADQPWPEDDDLLVVITPGQIRSRLLMNHYELPTERISRSLRRLAGIIVQGNYRVRSGTKAIAYPIQGSLFRLGVSITDSTKRVQEYALLFDTDWGRAFMHNVRSGNFVKVRDIPYGNLDNGAKQLFYISMTMTNREFYRGQGKLLELMNIKEKQNTRRGVERLKKYLNQLDGFGLITWWKEKEVYHINRRYNPVNGCMPGVSELRQ